MTPTDLLAATDGNVPADAGYPTLSLISLEANGVPRNYHRARGHVDAIDMSMVVRAADFGAAVALDALRSSPFPRAGKGSDPDYFSYVPTSSAVARTWPFIACSSFALVALPRSGSSMSNA